MIDAEYDSITKSLKQSTDGLIEESEKFQNKELKEACIQLCQSIWNNLKSSLETLTDFCEKYDAYFETIDRFK